MPPIGGLADEVSRAGSRAAAIKSKSARQGRGEGSLDTRMFVCQVSKGELSRNGETLTPLRFPCARPTECRYSRPWDAPCNYRPVSAEWVGEEVKSRTSSSLLT